jgi:hypothetical protein
MRSPQMPTAMKSVITQIQEPNFCNAVGVSPYIEHQQGFLGKTSVPLYDQRTLVVQIALMVSHPLAIGGCTKRLHE